MRFFAPSVGFEPTHPAPEASALSPELRGQGACSVAADYLPLTMRCVPKVLVVDDDPSIQRLVSLTFEMEGWTVVIADDGIAGLAAAKLESPDAILLDVMMPKMDGLSVASELKSDPDTSRIPVVLLSAKAQAGDLGAGMATGADEYITKPFDPLELLERVTALVER